MVRALSPFVLCVRCLVLGLLIGQTPTMRPVRACCCSSGSASNLGRHYALLVRSLAASTQNRAGDLYPQPADAFSHVEERYNELMQVIADQSATLVRQVRVC